MSLHAVHLPFAQSPAKVPERSVSSLSEAARRRLAVLRNAARVTRTRPYRSLEATCLTERDRTDPYESLVACLPEALGHPLVMYRTEEDSLSFDEVWLLSMLDRIEATDWDSLHFLINRRVSRPFRVAVRVLLGACQNL